ncbi:MAG: hypothetical protein SOZ67_07975 [Alloprevotella sp.]|nr:hypothetical protein [Alloprevotella sp.]
MDLIFPSSFMEEFVSCNPDVLMLFCKICIPRLGLADSNEFVAAPDDVHEGSPVPTDQFLSLNVLVTVASAAHALFSPQRSVSVIRQSESRKRFVMLIFISISFEVNICFSRSAERGAATNEKELSNPQKITCIIFENLFGSYFLPHQSHSTAMLFLRVKI